MEFLIRSCSALASAPCSPGRRPATLLSPRSGSGSGSGGCVCGCASSSISAALGDFLWRAGGEYSPGEVRRHGPGGCVMLAGQQLALSWWPPRASPVLKTTPGEPEEPTNTPITRQPPAPARAFGIKVEVNSDGSSICAGPAPRRAPRLLGFGCMCRVSSGCGACACALALPGIKNNMHAPGWSPEWTPLTDRAPTGATWSLRGSL